MTQKTEKIKVGLLTSSRADFGIYLPLLKKLYGDDGFNLSIIAFGTHLSRYHGYTLNQIEAQGFEVSHKIESLLLTDTRGSISSSVALTGLKFADFWNEHQDSFNVVFCLGDRFEMYAAVLAGVPFGIKFAHIHGGETTLGAIDNVYRHCISLASYWHFTSAQPFSERVAEIIGSDENVFNVGSISLENLLNMRLLSEEQFEEKFGIDLNIPSILITYHPETTGISKIKEQTKEMIDAFLSLAENYQLIITMPNTDTEGSFIREQYEARIKGNKRIFLKENFGTLGYFAAMKKAKLVLGNSSSGIIEAASFGKYVVNIGMRQEGRLGSQNLIHVDFSATEIVKTVINFATQSYQGDNVFDQGASSKKILEIIKTDCKNKGIDYNN